MRLKYLISIILLIIISSCVPEQNTATQPIQDTAGLPPTWTDKPPTRTLEPHNYTQTPSPTTILTPIIPPNTITHIDKESVGLGSEGPWLIYRKRDNEVYILNKDGSGRTKFPHALYGMHAAYDASSSLPMIAAITYSEMDYSPTLLILSLPDIETIQNIPLLSCPINIPGCILDEQADISFQPKWSPNGRYLAFVGAIEGPSTDVYVYDSELDTVKRLTDGPNQVGEFFWSPNSKWIVHEEISDFLGWVVESMWAASPVSNEVRWLFSPDSRRSQRLLGWVDDDRFITYEHSMYGEGNLNLISIQDGIGPTLFPGIFHEDIAFDPESGTIAFFPAVGAPKTDIDESGIYIISIYNTTPKRIEIDDLNIRGWFEDLGYFLTSATCAEIPGGNLGFKPDGSIKCVGNVNSSSSPNNAWGIIFNNGIYITDSISEAKLIMAGKTYADIVWRKDSEGVFIVPDGNIYYVDVNKLETEFINDDLYSTFNSINGRSFAQIMWIGK